MSPRDDRSAGTQRRLAAPSIFLINKPFFAATQLKWAYEALRRAAVPRQRKILRSPEYRNGLE